MENNRASEKQLAFLKKLGYEGDTSNLTAEEASSLIQQMSGGSKTTEKKNQVATTNNQVSAKQPSFSSFMANVGTKLVANTLTDEKRKSQFIANIVSAVSNNPTLQECDQVSVVSGGLQAEALHFPINNQLGYCYLVPFNDKKAGMKKAQFMIGFKGYIQLAIRTGQYKDIDAIEVKEGEIGAYDPINGQKYNWIQNPTERLKAKTVGYLAFLTLTNGFHKEVYMSYEGMLNHADTYSQAFSANATTKKMNGKTYNLVSYEDYKNGKYDKADEWLYSSFWYKDFTEMAKKTMIRKLLSKWGIMSVEMQQAYDNDMAAFDEKGNRDYIDSKDLKNDSIEDVMAEQINLNASEEFDVVDDETGEVNQDGLFSNFINQK